MTPVEERIDHEAMGRFTAQVTDDAHAQNLGGRHREGFCDACAEAHLVAQVAFMLIPLTEHSAREAVVKKARFLYEAFQADYYPDKHGMLVRDLGAALDALPATESAQPEEERKKLRHLPLSGSSHHP